MAGDAPPAGPLAEALAALGADDLERAAGLLEAALEAGPDAALARRIALLAVTAGADGVARRAAALLDEPGRAALAGLLDAAGGPTPDAGPDDLDVELPSGLAEGETAAGVSRFTRLFGARGDLYAEQHAGRHRPIWRPVRRPLLPRDVEAHLAGVRTLGQYVLRPDGRVTFAVVDLDLSPDARAELAMEPRGAGPVSHPALAEALRRVRAASRALGLEPALFDSGGKGAHAWYFLDPPRPARAARALLAAVLERAEPLPAAVTAELFPRQERPGPRGLSSLVKLPLGVHRGTGRWTHLLDETLEPVRDAGEALSRLAPLPPEAVDAVVSGRLVPLPSPELASVSAPAPPLPEGAPRPSDVASALRAIPAGAPSRGAEEAVVAGCRIVAAIVEGAFSRGKLSPAEARAVVYTLGLVGPEPELASRTLAAGRASPRALETARRGMPAPMGCRRLAELAPGQAGACDCPARAAPLLYRSPVAFALAGAEERRAPRMAPLEPLAPALYEDPLETIGKELRRLGAKVAELGAREGDEREAGRPGEGEGR